MLKKLSSIFIIFSLFSISVCKAQKAKIYLETNEFVTVISAIGKTEIFTESGNIPFSKIEKILFEKYDSTQESTYSKLKEQVNVVFGDGTDLGKITELPESLAENKNNVDISKQDTFVKIDSIDLSKDELYARAKSYFAYSFKSAQDVIQLDDKENGKIIAKGNFTSMNKTAIGRYGSRIQFTFTIDLRDGRFRGIIEDLYHDGLISDSSIAGGSFSNEKPAIGTLFLPKSMWEKIKIQGRLDAVSHLEDFVNYMKSKSTIDDF